MKLKFLLITVIFFMASFVQSQVKFRVKKLNADSLVKLISEKDGTEKINVLNILSNVICRKNIDSSINLATQAIELSEKLEYQKGLADGYFNVGNGYFLLDSLQPTISNYLKALRIYEDLEPSEEYGNLCMQLRMVNYFTGRFDEGNGYGRRALSIYERINDKTGQWIANFSMTNKEYDSAMYYLNKALALLDPKLEPTEVAYIYSEIGRLHYRQFPEFNDTTYLTKALSWFFKALELPEIADDVKAFIYLGMGRAYVGFNTDKSISKGIEYYQKIIPIADNCFDAYDIKNHAFEMLGWTYFMQDDYDKSIFYFEQAIKTIEERSNVSINDYKEPILAYNWKHYHKVNKKDIYRGLYYIYYDRGDFKKAIEYYELSRNAEEEIYKEKNQKMITMLESISEDEKTEKQMAMLAKDIELKELAIKQSRTYLFALAGFILILVLVGLLFFRQRKIRAEHKIFVREQKLLHDLELKNVESKKFKELDQLKSRFFANISHEFRTPLTLIKGPLEKALSQSENENQIKELGIAKKYIGKLQILINNLLTISKLESGKMELHASETDVGNLVGTYIQSFESLAKQKNITLNFKAEEGNIKAYIDREKFEQVLNNLLSNAFKFTGDGGVVQVIVGSRQYAKSAQLASSKIANCLLPTANWDGQWAEIKILDTGPGIAPEHINYIFDRFYQAGQEDKSYYEGTGIGLALTKELVELHHGKIEVRSDQGKGTTFSIYLPLGKDHLSPDQIEQGQPLSIEPDKFVIEPEFQNPELKTQNSEPETAEDIPLLLIVEDNADMRSYIRGYFENGFSIIESVDGVDGYKKSTEHIPDIIISDVMMPKMDGNEFCRKVKTDERTSHIPVILLTARAAKESRIEGLETGADDFITKPFDGDELLVRVNNLIEQRKRLRTVLERKIQTSSPTVLLDFKDNGITSMDDKFLQKARETVENNLSNPEYSIEDFASSMALSRSQLHRKLKALINSSGTEFMRAIRMNHALKLLKRNAGTISEIAYDVGFNSPTYFSQLFRQKFGMSPTEYQNNTEN